MMVSHPQPQQRRVSPVSQHRGFPILLRLLLLLLAQQTFPLVSGHQQLHAMLKVSTAAVGFLLAPQSAQAQSITLTATPGNKKVTLTWTHSGLGNRIDWKYIMTGDGRHVSRGGLIRPTAEITGLKNGVEYTFRVEARRLGVGITFATSNTVTATPTAPSTKTITLSATSASITEGDSGFTDVTVTATLGEGAPPADIDTGNFSITAISDSTTRGTSTGSNKGSSPCTPPLSPVDTDWCYPSGATISFAEGETQGTMKVRILGDTRDEPNETIRLVGHATGWTSGRLTLTITDDDATPAKPTGFSAMKGDKWVYLTWSNPNDASITRWEYRQKTGAGNYGSWTPIPSSGAATVKHQITSLTNGTIYKFKIRAVNSNGNGVVSDEVTATPNPATAPVLTGATSTSNRNVTLTWTHAGSTAADYINGGTGTVFWQTGHRLKGTTTWQPVSANVSQVTGNARRTLTTAGLGNSYPNGTLVEVAVRASGSSLPLGTSGIKGPWSNERTVTYMNTNTAALTLTGAPVTVAPGSTATYTVALTKAYAGTLSITSANTDKATVSPGTLNFTTSDYNTGQTVRVTGVDAGSATINHAFRLTGATADVIPDAGTVAVTVTDTTPTLQLLTDPAAVSEGEHISLTVTSDKELTGNVLVNLTLSARSSSSFDADDITGTLGPRDFTASFGVSASRRGTVSIPTSSDSDTEGAEAYRITLNTGSGYVRGTDYTADGTLNDVVTTPPGVTISPTSLTVEEGSNGKYTVVLSTVPSATVTITVGGASGEVTVTGSPLTFTPGNWDTAQTVTVNAGTDVDRTNDSATLTHSASSSDTNYSSSLVIDDVSVTVTDVNPTLQLLTNPSVVSEGEAIELTVTADRRVTGSLTVGATLADRDSSGFTAADIEGDLTRNLSFSAGGTMLFFNGGTTATASIHTIEDSDSTEGTEKYRITLDEPASDAGYTLGDDKIADGELKEQPAGPVLTGVVTSTTNQRIDLTWTHAGTSIEDIVGTQANRYRSFWGWRMSHRLKGTTTWSEPVFLDDARQFTARSGNKSLADAYPNGAAVEVRIRAEALTRTDDNNGGPWSNVLMVIYKNDATPALVFTGSPVTVVEGATATYTVALGKAYGGVLSISSSAASRATVEPASLTFTTGNYNTAQTVRVTGVDAGSATINHAFRLTGARADAIPDAGTVAVTVTGSGPDVTISPTTLTINEGGSGQYTVKLDTAPSADVTVTVGGASGEVTVTGSPLTFTTGNWDTAQTVTVNAGPDADTTDDSATLIHRAASSDTNYGASLAIEDVTVTVTDPTLQLLTDPDGVTEGEDITLTVTSDKELTGDVTVNLTLSDRDSSGFTAADITGTLGPRDFTASFGSSGSTTGTVSIPTSPDEVVEGAETYRITLNEGRGYAVGAEKTAEGTLNDPQPAAGVTISPTTLPINEGSSGQYTVKLDSAPSADVTVTVGGASGEVTVTGSPLTFTPTNWATAQPVTVNAGTDVDTTDDEATLTHTAASSDTDYGASLAIEDVTVTVTDPTLQLSTDPDGVSEGEDIILMVTSDKELTGDVTVNLTLSDRGSSGFTAADIAGTLGPRDFTASFGSSGSTTGTVSIATSTDEDVEGAETYRITLNEGRGYAVGAEKTAEGTLNDASAGVTISPTTLTMDEGSSGQYTVKLDSAPSSDVTVTVGGASGDVTVTGSPLTFTPGNWATTQTVTVNAGPDADITDDSATLTHTAASSDTNYGASLAIEEVTVTVTDTPPTLQLLTNPPAVSEGTAIRLVVRSDRALTGNVTVNLTLADRDSSGFTAADIAGTLGPRNFTASFGRTGSTGGTVSIATSTDEVAEDAETYRITLNEGRGYVVGADKTAEGTLNDATVPAGITVSATRLSLTEGGAAETYTVVLDSNPSAAVTVTPRSSDPGAASVSGAISFDATNWSTARTVTVTPVDDGDATDETITVSNAVRGAGRYADVRADSVTVTVEDDDEPGVTIEPTELSLREGGSTGSYTVKLNTDPEATVTVTPSSNDAGAARVSAALSFDATNWDTARTVTVTPVDDGDATDETVTVGHAITGYGGVSNSDVANVTVAVEDDETAGVTITPKELSLSEDGTATTYMVVLDSNPLATVTLTPSSGDAGAARVSAALSFDSSNWDTAQLVTVTPVDDDDANNETVTVSHAITGYGGVSNSDVANVTVVVEDDETAGVTITPTELSLSEGGTATTYMVVLDSNPLATVTLTPSSSDAGAVSVSAALSFDSSNWDTAQLVTVTPVDDDDANDETVMVGHAITGYGGVSSSDVANVTVAVEDDETAGVTITPTELSLSEGGTATTYMVVLDSNPLATVTLTPSSGDAGAARVSAALSFDSSNWDTAQLVTVTPVDDDDANDEIVTVGHAISGYGGVSNSDVANVTVRVAEPGVTVTPTTLQLEEGGSPGTYTVVLDAMPSGNVTLTPSPTGADAAAAMVSAALTFTTANWDTAQSVTVTPVDDADANDETVMVGHAIIGYPRVSDSDVDEVAVTVADDDTAGVTVTPIELSLSEGGTAATYTVVLDTMPSGNVTVTPGSGDSGAVTVSGAFTFTPSNWNTGQSVMVTPVEDDDANDETVVVTHAITGYGTVRTADSVMVMVTDDETEDRPQVEVRKEELVGLSRATLGMATDMIGARVGGDLSGSNAGAGAIGEQALGVMGNLLGFSHGSELSTNLSLEQLGEQLWNQSFHISQPDSESEQQNWDITGAQRGRWSLWGAGELRSFKGKDASDAEDHSYSGSIKAGWLGVDYQFSNAWLAGLAVSFSSAESDYTYRSQDGTGAGKTETQLTTFYPYGSLQLTERLKLWGTAGIGFGDLRHQDNDEDDNREDKGELKVHLAAIGFEQQLSSLAAWNLFSLAGDLAFVQSSTEWQDNALTDQSVSITRARLGVNSSFPLSQTTTGYMNLRGRLDGGDLQMGAAEMVLGLRYSTGRFSALLQGRQTSALDGSYSESGLLGELRFSSQEDGTGLALQLQPSYGEYGEVGSQQASLWNDQQLDALAGWNGDSQAGGAMALKSTMGYGFLLPAGNVLLTPFAEVAFIQGNRQQIGLGISMQGSSWEVKLSGSREESSNTAPNGTVKVMFSKQL